MHKLSLSKSKHQVELKIEIRKLSFKKYLAVIIVSSEIRHMEHNHVLWNFVDQILRNETYDKS